MVDRGAGSLEVVHTIIPALRDIVAFARPDEPLDEVLDDLSAVLLFARRNGVAETTLEPLAQARDLGGRLVEILINTGSSERAVKHTFKAMVYATVEHTLVDIALTGLRWDPFTLLTTGAAFVLDRLAEYAYVEGAREGQQAELHVLSQAVGDAMWDALARNPQTRGVSWEQCQAYRTLVRQMRAALDASPSSEPATRFFTLLFYVRLLEALQVLENS